MYTNKIVIWLILLAIYNWLTVYLENNSFNLANLDARKQQTHKDNIVIQVYA